MNKLKLTLIIALIMKSLNYFKQTKKIVLVMNVNLQN